MSIRFSAKYDWALLPFKNSVSADDAKRTAEIYEQNFRWLRAYRTPEQCWPWRVGQELGWLVPSPVDISLSPLHDQEITADFPNEELVELYKITGWTELWRRDRSSIGFPKAPWLRLYDFHTDDGWQTMFVPNGQGTVEWKLGWRLEVEEGQIAVVLPLSIVLGFEIPVGVFTAKTLANLNALHGISIALRPLRKLTMKRGQPIARIVVCAADTLSVKAEFSPA